MPNQYVYLQLTFSNQKLFQFFLIVENGRFLWQRWSEIRNVLYRHDFHSIHDLGHDGLLVHNDKDMQKLRFDGRGVEWLVALDKHNADNIYPVGFSRMS